MGHWFKCNLSVPPQFKKLTRGSVSINQSGRKLSIFLFPVTFHLHLHFIHYSLSLVRACLAKWLQGDDTMGI